jgi:5-methylcytosine-specific restriction endonuclease McrA
MSTTCPTCAESFDDETGMKVHHRSVHGESLAKTTTLECERCGENYKTHPNQAEVSRFCSNECQISHRKGHGGVMSRGEDNPHWEGGAARSRERALERDGYTCQRCGCEVGDGLREKSYSAEVHHIIPRSAGGPDTLSNLVTLCWECHMKAHKSMQRWVVDHPDLLNDLRDVVCNE